MFLPKVDLLPNWPKSAANFPPTSSSQANDPAAFVSPGAPSHKFFTLGPHTLGLKQAAISIILSEVIINPRPVPKAEGLYSYDLPPPCQVYLNAAITEKVPAANMVRLKVG